MIELYSTNLAVTQNQNIPWDGKAVQRGYAATLSSDGTSVILCLPGVYEVTVTANGQTTSAGSFGLSLKGDGNAITRASYSVTAEAGSAVELSFTTLIAVNGVYGSFDKAKLTLAYTGGAGSISLVDMVVKKVYDA